MMMRRALATGFVSTAATTPYRFIFLSMSGWRRRSGDGVCRDVATGGRGARTRHSFHFAQVSGRHLREAGKRRNFPLDLFCLYSVQVTAAAHGLSLDCFSASRRCGDYR